ncbi:MAG: FAD-dependent pyridine nucleotide-disulfide oxidoreductase [Thermoleophilia bacterium]|nr:FAD-dependent pyridine nucleotide-disulfide oxidoreductase [Thermoleophilia bacterium]
MSAGYARVVSAPAPTEPQLRVAIVGGGAAGSIVAGELLRRDAPLAIDLYERRGDIGPGLAYSTPDPHHLVNVPAGKLSADPESPTHLMAWLERNGHPALPETFAQRRVYGQYLRELFAERRAAAMAAQLTTSSEPVLTIRPTASGVELCAEHDPGPRDYDAVVLALGNVAAPPAIDLPHDPRAFASPWAHGALEPDPSLDAGSVLIVGTGLTAVDAALSLAAASPTTRLVLASRNGRLPFAHLPGPLREPAPSTDFPGGLTTLDELVAAWEAHVASCREAGFDWRDVVDGLRPRTQGLWRTLGVAEQGRFLRERRRDWEARRNRAAPEVGARLDELVASGRLEVVRGGVTDIRAEDDGIHARVGEAERSFARVVSCTGPTVDVTRCNEPLLRQLLADGVVAADPHLLGIRTADDGRVLDAQGAVNSSIFTLGWLRRGELWETLAIPEIRSQAAAIAEQLSRRTAPGSPRSRELAR